MFRLIPLPSTPTIRRAPCSLRKNGPELAHTQILHGILLTAQHLDFCRRPKKRELSLIIESNRLSHSMDSHITSGRHQCVNIMIVNCVTIQRSFDKWNRLDVLNDVDWCVRVWPCVLLSCCSFLRKFQFQSAKSKYISFSINKSRPELACDARNSHSFLPRTKKKKT